MAVTPLLLGVVHLNRILTLNFRYQFRRLAHSTHVREGANIGHRVIRRTDLHSRKFFLLKLIFGSTSLVGCGFLGADADSLGRMPIPASMRMRILPIEVLQ
jgi:hypothetical protein